MAELEKVIKGLEEAEIMLAQAVNRGGEMAVMQAYKCENRVRDALELLKEQRATMVIESENMYPGIPITHCPKCGKSLDRYLYGRRQEGEINFCPYCGQAVKWYG